MDDQDFTLFLWLSNPENPESEFEVYCFKVVQFGSAIFTFHVECYPTSKWLQWKQTTKVLHLQTETTADTDESMSAEGAPQTSSTGKVPQTGIHNILQIFNHSSLSKLLRVTAFLLRFINNVRNSATRNTGTLSTQESNNTLSVWIYDCQQTCFHQEHHEQLKLKATKCSSLVRQLRLFLDAEVYICCGGRIHNAPLS